MKSFLAGSSVILACIFTIYCYSQLIFVKHIKINNESNVKEKLIDYKSKMKNIYLIGFIMFFIIGVLGYLLNCKFAPFDSRVAGVQQFVSFFAIFAIFKYIENRKEKHIVKIEKINRKKNTVIVMSALFICITFTIVSILI